METQIANDLLALADDAYIVGLHLSDMLTKGPSIEENVALASIGQDEIGHAILIYRMLASFEQFPLWKTEDDFAYKRPIEQFRCAQLMESDSKAWDDVVIANILYKTAQMYFIDRLLQKPDELGEAVGIISRFRQEESYNLRHWDMWVTRLANTTIGMPRLQNKLEEKWAAAIHYFAGTSLENDAQWKQHVKAKINSIPLAVPANESESGIHRRTNHTADLYRVLNTSRELVNAGIGTKW